MSEGENYDPRESFFRIDRWKYGRCFAPGVDCTEPPIRAHSIQNAGQLELLAEGGHLMAFARRFQDGAPEVDFGAVGRNRATTFLGLCAEHDAEIFSPIERRQIDVSDAQHLFLLAYRATVRELHAAAEAASKVQTSYLERVEAGEEPKDEPSPHGIFAVQRMMIAYETFMYKLRLDDALLHKAFDELVHDVIRIKTSRASIGVSSVYSLDHVRGEDDTVRVCLSVLPLSQERTAALFSYLERDAGKARAALERVFAAEGSHQQYEISRIVLNSCENFVISPAVYDSWSTEKREAIRSYFFRTLFQDDLSYEDENLHLFA